jgi:hypothetical protein
MNAQVRDLGVDIGEGSSQMKSFLIMPIQRIPRYELLLRVSIKHTMQILLLTHHFPRI